MTLVLSASQIRRVWNTAWGVVKKSRQFDLREIEYRSAINLAVAKAIAKHDESRHCELSSLAATYAMRACSDTKTMLSHWRHQDEAARERPIPTAVPVEIPIAADDHTILEFVAAHGRGNAAQLLAMSRGTFRKLLDEIDLRIRAGIT